MAESPFVEFISAGPGAPDLLTVAGARRLARCPAVLAPATFQRSFAESLADKTFTTPFQMRHEQVVAWVEHHLPRGPVAFLVPGDASSFSPFQSFVGHFGPRARLTPGVGSVAAAAAVLGRSFDLAGVAHATILTSPRAFARSGARVRLRDYASPGHTLVLFMNDLPLAELTAELRSGYGRDTPMAILENLSCPDERVTRASLDTMAEILGDHDPFGLETKGAEPRLALVIVGDVLSREEDPAWWDRRYEKIWKPRGMR